MIAATTPTKLDPRDENLYLEWEQLINKACWKFIKGYGGTFEDVKAEANFYYIEAIQEYDPDRGTQLSSHIFHWIWTRLVDEWRRETNRRKRYGIVSFSQINRNASEDQEFLITDPTPNPQDAWTADNFLSTLTKDSRTVALLCLNTPENISKIVEGKGGTPRNYRSSIKQWLESIGWSYDRIKESFDEIKTALK